METKENKIEEKTYIKRERIADCSQTSKLAFEDIEYQERKLKRFIDSIDDNAYYGTIVSSFHKNEYIGINNRQNEIIILREDFDNSIQAEMKKLEETEEENKNDSEQQQCKS